jgi:hypothetical protein
VAAEDNPHVVVGVAAQALEVVVAVGIRQVAFDAVVVGVLELDDGAAQGLAAGIGDGAP